MMKRVLAAGLLVMGVAGVVMADDAATPSAGAGPKTEREKIGYAIGQQVGAKLKGMDVDPDQLAAGVRDALAGKTQMTDEEMAQAMTALRAKLIAQHEAEVAKNMDEGTKAGKAFLDENAKKDGVKVTASGLQYKVIKSGSGKTPKATDTVSVYYKGTLISGKTFDETHGDVATFPVNGVIKGWTEALQLMKEGDKWTLYIPSNLAYGEGGTPDGSIGPNETLIFDVELVAVK